MLYLKKCQKTPGERPGCICVGFFVEGRSHRVQADDKRGTGPTGNVEGADTADGCRGRTTGSENFGGCPHGQCRRIVALSLRIAFVFGGLKSWRPRSAVPCFSSSMRFKVSSLGAVGRVKKYQNHGRSPFWDNLLCA